MVAALPSRLVCRDWCHYITEQYRFTLAPYRVQTAEYAARFPAVGALNLRRISNVSSTPEDAALSPEGGCASCLSTCATCPVSTWALQCVLSHSVKMTMLMYRPGHVNGGVASEPDF